MLIFKKEKKVAKLVEAHATAAAECLATATRAIEAYTADELEQAKQLAREVDGLEKQADLIRRDVRDKLYSGAFLPLIREDIYKLVEAVDKVANAGETCCDFFLSQRPDIPAEMRPQFVDVLGESFNGFPPLAEAMHAYFKPKKGIDTVRELAKQVGERESAVDTKEWQLTRTIFRSSLELSQKLHLRLALDHIVEVSDRAEDACDQLELVSLKSVI